jgi:hypothetical protein
MRVEPFVLGMRRVREMALGAALALAWIACATSTGPGYSLAGLWVGGNFNLLDVQQSGGAVTGTMAIGGSPPSMGGISTGPGSPEITAPMSGQVAGSLIELKIGSFAGTPASTWSGHFRDANTVLGTWTVGVQSIPDSLVRSQ